jgi:hypothetical protein
LILSVYTFIHVVLSLVGIGSGAVVVQGMLVSKRRDEWTAIFLVTTLATSLTGFGFPFEHVLPAHVVGLLSLIALVAAMVARYPYQLVGRWRLTYVTGAVVALYFNVFVLIAQAFLKIPALKAMAPTQSDPPFVVAQLVALVAFVALGIFAARRFQPVVSGPDGHVPVGRQRSSLA